MTRPSAPNTPSAAPDPGSDRAFDSALRGYDRKQVDDYVAAAATELGRLRAEVAEGQRKLRLATEHAEATELELREARNRPPAAATAAEEGFGFRAEKLLRLAETEAADVRAHASRESAAIIEKARTEAEHHRHEVEQALIARASLMEQQASQRASELADREQQISDQLATAREQADELQSDAARAAERLRSESEAAAEQTRLRAEQAAARIQEKSTQELTRLSGLQADVRAELGRLAGVLSSELGSARDATPEPRDGSHDDIPDAESPAAVDAPADDPDGAGGPVPGRDRRVANSHRH